MEKVKSIKVIKYLHKISKHSVLNQSQFLKSALVFTTFSYITSLYSVNKYMCCDLQSIARNHEKK